MAELVPNRKKEMFTRKDKTSIYDKADDAAYIVEDVIFKYRRDVDELEVARILQDQYVSSLEHIVKSLQTEIREGKKKSKSIQEMMDNIGNLIGE